ncbi:hypothetical protein K431DRAFT_313700 [Polychaeton citri CBS 116435]|uniref:MARVEL domain-containing protein n=1 Tax=Polychaeton citri CBS 116435 TaxID=1314669 RepID=A0A9P4UNR1_9PEZI|nr:hypothetical protein K431DRAFT_313700 [Polychaeton citri CBS 116435]
MRIPIYIVRALQLIFSVITLALAVEVADKFSDVRELCKEAGKKECPGSVIDALGTWVTAYDYSAFAGAWGLFSVLVGLVALFVSFIPVIAVIVVDALAAIFFVAAGGRLASLLSDTGSCNSSSVCTKAEATCAFAWIGFVAALVLIGLEVFRSKKEGKTVMHSTV